MIKCRPFFLLGTFLTSQTWGAVNIVVLREHREDAGLMLAVTDVHRVVPDSRSPLSKATSNAPPPNKFLAEKIERHSYYYT